MEVSCPVSTHKVNEIVIRIIALMVVIIAIACLIVRNYDAIFFLVIDFGLRAFTSGKFSLLKIIALQIFKNISTPAKLTDLAPKKFAAALGFIFCLTICAFDIFQMHIVATILTITLLIFAILESVFSICVGCYVYTFLRKIGPQKK